MNCIDVDVLMIRLINFSKIFKIINLLYCVHLCSGGTMAHFRDSRFLLEAYQEPSPKNLKP